ncbi:hypothetical protein BD289DRAFT_507999 [Coniella lustricola]|uniref:Uncharacterized protein n=1 Tax=Coniella lustricola TaxID=2025994 RepID=A0A2T3A0K6_9PEZI|nr:hypothetical protein BD289DRAFT_507999 [Coniella lustricola]
MPDQANGTPYTMLWAASHPPLEAVFQQKLAMVVDTIKTPSEDSSVLLVGGGAVISADELKGAGKVRKPWWSEVIDAIGAAMAVVSAVVDIIKSTESR